jgi:hypothetical protein
LRSFSQMTWEAYSGRVMQAQFQNRAVAVPFDSRGAGVTASYDSH